MPQLDSSTIPIGVAHWPEAIMPSDTAARTALRERHLQPCVMTLDPYKSRLDRQARGASVATLKGVSILLATGEDKCEEDSKFIG